MLKTLFVIPAKAGIHFSTFICNLILFRILCLGFPSENSEGGGGKIIKVVLTFTIPNRLEYFLAGPVLLYRRLRYGYAFRRITLTQGKFAIVDPDDYYRLSEYKWSASRVYNKFR